MSLNFFETLLDRLSSRDSGNSVLKNWTGSHNLTGSNVSFNDSILLKYQEALLEANDSSSTNLSIKRSPFDLTMLPFHNIVSPNSLVSRVSKLFFPTALSFQDYRNQDISTNHKISVNKAYNPEINLWEEFMQEAFNLAVNLSKYHSSNFEHIHNPISSAKPSNKKTDFSDINSTVCTSSGMNKVPMVVDCFIERSPLQRAENCVEPKSGMKANELNVVVVTANGSSTISKNKFTADNGTLNQELANRKTKEIQKRSKNRRRRQKRNNKNKNNFQKSSSSISCDQIPVLQSQCAPVPAASPIDCNLLNDLKKCESKSSAKLCSVINITDNANSVQIILPSVSSFVITVDSAGEDSDWDENSDCEWLNDTSDFEFCGLNIANLPCSKTNTSLLSVPPCPDEDVELLQLNMLLQRVNKEWNEATKDVEGKLRSPTKVSFLPDEELVEVLPVEIYERKGEWEMYAIERLRFKRRIDELDEIISPCLGREHREKILQKYHAIDS